MFHVHASTFLLGTCNIRCLHVAKLYRELIVLPIRQTVQYPVILDGLINRIMGACMVGTDKFIIGW